WLIAAPVIAVAAGDPGLFPCSGTDISQADMSNGHPCTFGDLVMVAQTIAKRIVQTGLILAPLVFAYAGFLLLTSQDNPSKRIKARKVFINVAIGLVIMMIAWVIVNLVLTSLLCPRVFNSPGFPWLNPNSTSGPG